MHIHPVCTANNTRSVWAEAFGRKNYSDNPNLKFSSSGILAESWSNLDTVERITFIANVALEMAVNPDNDFSYDRQNKFRPDIERAVQELGLEHLDISRLSSDTTYRIGVQTGLKKLLVETMEPHERFIRDLAMKELGVQLPPNTNAQTTYDPNIDLYLAMSKWNKDSLDKLIGSQANGKIFSATEYGIQLVEPTKAGIFACANMDKYLDYVKQIEKVINKVVTTTKNGRA